jgi:competence protein ComEC
MPLPALLCVLVLGSAGFELGSSRIPVYVAMCAAFSAACIAAVAGCGAKGFADAASKAVLCAAATAACCLSTSACLVNQAAAVEKIADEPVSNMAFEIVKDAVSTSSGWRAEAVATLPDGTACKVWLVTKERHERGTVLAGYGSATIPSGEFAAFLARKGIVARVSLPYLASEGWSAGATGLVARVRTYVAERVDASASEGRSLVAGAVLGMTTEMRESGLSDDFSTTGLSHLVAVSAGHLAVVASLAQTVLERRGMRPRARCAAIVAATGAYVLLCGEPTSAVRAWIMTCCAQAAHLAGRRAHGATSCSFCGIGMCLLDPTAVSDLGLLLSLSCVLALFLLGPLMRAFVDGLKPKKLPAWIPYRARRKLHGAIDGALELLSTSLLCALASAPLCAAYFGQVSLIAPVCNLVAGPLFEPFIAAGIVSALGCWIPGVSDALLGLTGVYGDVLAAGVRVMAAVPYASFEIDVPEWTSLAVPILAGTAAYLAWPRPEVRSVIAAAAVCAAVLSVAAVAKTYLAPAQVTMLDVGQGDSILVREGSRSVLVDAGPEGCGVASDLVARGVTTLDAVVVTHAHEDHEGDLEAVLERVDVGCVVVARGSAATYEGLFGDAVAGKLVEIGAGERFSVGSFTFEAVWPGTDVDATENADSVVMYVTYEGARTETVFLFTGDAESDTLAAVADAGLARDVDVLKVGHHGSKVSITEEEAALYDPEVAIVSAGAGNSYGHPTEACLSILRGAGAEVFCTIECGDITVLPDEDGVVVKTAA